MQYREESIVYKGKEWFNIVPIGDVHLGNSNCDLEAFKDMVDWIKNKDNTFWIGMGDFIDAINYSDPRFDPKTIALKYLADGDIDSCIQHQIGDFVDIIRPIKNKCIGLLRGNHEEACRRHYHYDVLYELAKELDLKRDLLLYDTAIIRLTFHRQKSRTTFSYDIFCAHGNVGGRTYGAKANRISELHKFFLADIYLLAHSHIKQAQVNTILYFNKKGQESKQKIVDAFTGCFLQGYVMDKTSYVEKCLLPPSDIGCVKIQLQPDRGDKHCNI